MGIKTYIKLGLDSSVAITGEDESLKLNVISSSSRLLIISNIYFELKPISISLPEYMVVISSVAVPLSEFTEIHYIIKKFKFNNRRFISCDCTYAINGHAKIMPINL